MMATSLPGFLVPRALCQVGTLPTLAQSDAQFMRHFTAQLLYVWNTEEAFVGGGGIQVSEGAATQ